MSQLNKDLPLFEQRTLWRDSHESYFDWKHFEDSVLEGKWDDAENYLSGFNKVDENYYSNKIYFEMRKQKYLEALDNNLRRKAYHILLKDLIVIAPNDEGVIKELTELLIVDNIRERVPTYQDANSSRKNLIDEIMEIIIQNPFLVGKLQLPLNESHRICHLLNGSLNWQRLPNADLIEPNLSTDCSNSKASTSVLTNPGTSMVWVPSTNGRACINFDDERDCNTVLRPSQFQFLKLPMCPEVQKIVKLAYNNQGNSILALASNGVHAVWVWERNDFNLDGKATAQVCPKLKEPKDGPLDMINDLPNVQYGNPISCFAITKNDQYIISTSGGKVSLFHMVTFETLTYIMSPPPTITCLAIHPDDNNIIALGYDDSSIIVYHVRYQNVLQKLQGHSKRVTGLAFSKTSNILISGDANARIILWNTNGWEKLKEKNLHIQGNELPISSTQIQFHPDQTKFLVVHIGQLAIYEPIELRCVNQWVAEVPVLISQATFSCDGQAVYSIFADETMAIFDATNLQIRFRFYPCSYLPQFSSWSTYPISIAAHPQKPAQFVVGFSDGSVLVCEPREPKGKWIENH